MSNEYFTFFIDEKTVSEINASAKGLFTVPTEAQNDTLYVKSDTEKKWRELLEVRDTSMDASEDKEHIIFKVQYRVTDDGYAEPNRGRIMTKSYWVSKEGLKNASHDEHKKSKMNMTKMFQLLKACGITPVAGSDGNVPLHEYFNGTDKPLVGKVFWGIIRDYVYVSRREGVGVVNDQDVDKFIKVDQ